MTVSKVDGDNTHHSYLRGAMKYSFGNLMLLQRIQMIFGPSYEKIFYGRKMLELFACEDRLVLLSP